MKGSGPGFGAFFRTWLAGYIAPQRFAQGLQTGPAPQWGLWAVLLRSTLDALGLYLPMALLGRVPPTPSYLTFLPTRHYYAALVGLTPVVFFAEWLLGAAVVHVVLRMARRSSDFDRILVIQAMASWVVGAFLFAWDWAWIELGGLDQVALGVSHLVIDFWWFVLVVVALKRLLDVPVGWGIGANLLAFAAVMPLSVIVMRSPL